MTGTRMAQLDPTFRAKRRRCRKQSKPADNGPDGANDPNKNADL